MNVIELRKRLRAQPKDRIIVALDVDSVDKALALVDKLYDHVGGFKIGLQLFVAMFVELLVAEKEETAHVQLAKMRALFTRLGEKLFLDLKFNDIPNTIKEAMAALLPLKAFMKNMHASAGVDAMLDAVAKKGDSILLAVTVLTAFEENEAHLNFGAPSKAQVLQFSRNALVTGVDGVVSSPGDLRVIGKRRELEPLLKVTPNIRSESDPADDQERARSMTAGEAIKAGADYLVIGRPITKYADDPVARVKLFELEIANAQGFPKAA